MERDSVPRLPESKVPDRMGDVHSKDFKNVNSSQRELLQEGNKPSSPTCLKYPSAVAASPNFIETRQDYPASPSSESFSVVDTAVEALEDGEISNENETISRLKYFNNQIIPIGPNTSQPIFLNDSESLKITQQIDSDQNESTEENHPAPSVEMESTKEIQLAPSVEMEFTKEIQLAPSVEMESTNEIHPALSVENESTEEIRAALSKELEFVNETQSAISVKMEFTEEIQPALSVETESTEEIQPALSVEAESTEEIQLPLSVDPESGEETQPASSVKLEYNEKIQLSPSLDIESIYRIHPALSVENESIEEIRPALSEEAEFVNETQPAISVKIETTEEIQPALSVETESPEKIHPPLFVDTGSVEKTHPAFSVKIESTKEIQLASSADIESTDEIHPALPVENEPTEEIQQSKETKSTQVKDQALSEGSLSTPVINSLLFENPKEILAPVSEAITSTIVIQSVISEETETTESIQSVHSEAKLTKAKQPVLSEEFNLNEGIESHSLATDSNEKVILPTECIKSQVPSNTINPAVDPEISSKVLSEIDLDSSNPQENLNSPFSSFIDLDSFLSLLNAEEYKNASHFAYVNDQAGCGGQVIVTPTSPLPELNIPTLVKPQFSPPTENLPMKSNLSSESIQPITSTVTKLTEVKQPVISEDKLNEYMELNSVISKSIEKAITSSQSKSSEIHSNDTDSSAEPKMLSKVLSQSSNPEENSNSFPPIIDAKSFFSSLNTDECRNGSHFGHESKKHQSQSDGRLTVPPSLPPPKQNFPTYEVPQFSPTTESNQIKAIENLSSKLTSYLRNSGAASKSSYLEEKSNPSVPPVLDNQQFDSKLKIKEYKGGEPFAMAGKGVTVVKSRSPCKPSSLNFEMLPSPPAKNPPMKLTGNLRPNKEANVPADIPSRTCEPISPNLEGPPLSALKKDVPTDIPSKTCEPICPNLEMSPLSPFKKNLPKPSMKNLSLSYNKLLPLLLSRLADWIYRGMENVPHFLKEPVGKDLINYFKRELENGVDLLTQMDKHVDSLLTAVEGLPDPNSILPYEPGRERISSRDRAVSAGALLLRKIEKMKKEIILDRDRFYDFYSAAAKSSIDGSLGTKVASKGHDIIYRLYVKISENYLKLSMEVEKFRDHVRDLVNKLDMLRKKD